VQAGHDDIGVPPAPERQRVEQAIAAIRAAAPRARIVLLTVFGGRSPAAAASRTDRAIVTAARAADRAVIIIDPTTSTAAAIPGSAITSCRRSPWSVTCTSGR
jgi:hypothetical protein